MTPQQKKWADYVINGKNHQEAYLLAYPKASKKTASNQLGAFRQNLGLMDYINQGIAKITAKVEAKTIEKLANIEIGNVLTSAKKRELLALIALGELEQEKMVLVKDAETKKNVWRKILIKPDLFDRMKAIDLDNKMTGEIYRGKSNENEKPKDEIDNNIFNNVTFVFKSKEK